MEVWVRRGVLRSTWLPLDRPQTLGGVARLSFLLVFASEGWVISSALHSPLDTSPLAAAQGCPFSQTKPFPIHHCPHPLFMPTQNIQGFIVTCLPWWIHREPQRCFQYQLLPNLYYPHTTVPTLYGLWLWDKDFYFPKSTENTKI